MVIEKNNIKLESKGMVVMDYIINQGGRHRTNNFVLITVREGKVQDARTYNHI